MCGIEFIVNQGEKVALLGPNGGGKTTLIRHILGVLTPSHGTIKVFGVNPAVDEFCLENNYTPRFTSEWFGTWYFKKKY
jgi:ABC-type multidrug transport system ATPase subunit